MQPRKLQCNASKPVDAVELRCNVLDSITLTPATTFDHAVLLPFAFFFGTSLIVRPGCTFSLHFLLLAVAHVAEWQTWRQALLELLGFVGVLENEGVEVALAPDLELDGVCLVALLDARRCCELLLVICPSFNGRERLRKPSQDASLRRQISMNCLISWTSFGMLGDAEEIERVLRGWVFGGQVERSCSSFKIAVFLRIREILGVEPVAVQLKSRQQLALRGRTTETYSN